MSFCDLEDELNCSICLSIYIEPVTLRCGHSFCGLCIQKVLDSQILSGVYSCPDCRKRFKSRPAPRKNTTLCNVVKHFQSVSSADNILCTYCIKAAVLAARSCLLCEASLCNSHLSVHSKSPEHVIVAPTKFSQNKNSSKLKSHQNQNKKEILRTLTLKRKTIVDHIQSLVLHRREEQNTADSYTLRTRVLFGELKRSLYALEKRVLNEILRQEKQVSFSVDDIIKQLEVRNNDLSKQIAYVEICNMTSNFSVSESEIDGLTNIEDEGTNGEQKMLEDNFYVDRFIPILISETVQRDLHDFITNTKPLYNGTEAIDISLDDNTAGHDIVVSKDQKTLSWSRIKRKHTTHPERFQACSQVLSTRSFSPGRYYWEIETCDSRIWRIGVAYPSIDRRDLKSRIGDNDKSWCLCRYKEEYSVRHNDKKTSLSSKVLASRLGVYLDSQAGTLSFYELGDPIEQLYTFSTTFSEPLYAALYLGQKGRLRIRETG